MSSREHLAKCYNEISDHADRAAKWLKVALQESPPYPRDALISRLKQSIAEALHTPLLVKRRKEIESTVAQQIPRPHEITIGGLTINTLSGAIRPNIGVTLRSFASFLKHWLLILWECTKSIRPFPRQAVVPATLVWGIPEAAITGKDGDAEFLDFCSRGPITALRDARHLIVQTNRQIYSTRPERATYCRWPLFYLLAGQRLSLYDYVRFVLTHIQAVIVFVINVYKCRVTCLLNRDFAYHGLVATLNRLTSIENAVLTNSYFNEQALWMTNLPHRKFSTHMAFYSMLNSAFVFEDAPIRAVVPAFPMLRADHFWVWTRKQAEFLHSLGVTGDIHVAGPILWRLPQTTRALTPTCLSIAVFDVTPVLESVAGQLGLSYNYYQTDNALRFIEDILSIRALAANALEIDIWVFCKHKREHFSTVHDSRYLERMADLGANAKVVPSNTNPYALLCSCDLAIVMPFSSPAYIAASMGVPAIYYDPTSELLPTQEPDPLVYFASGFDSLRSRVIELLSMRKTATAALSPMQPTNVI